MKNIAALLTSFNRKDKTIKCLNNLYQAITSSKHQLSVTIYLTDNGNDKTGEAVANLFKGAVVLKGSENLFWTGGMINSWSEAQKHTYDGYLLLNDDTYVMDNVFDDLMDADEFCIANFKRQGIYIGTTIDKLTQKTTYGGTVFINRFFNTYKMLHPNGQVQSCDLGNGNIMYVPSSVHKQIGMLSGEYTHAIADYDYSLTAAKNNIPVLVTANYCGECRHDHVNKYDQFKKMDLSHRIKFSNNPIGFAFPDMLSYMKKNFPYRLPFFFIAGWFKVIFPRTYILMNKLR